MDTGRRSFFSRAALGAVAGAVVANRADAAPPAALPAAARQSLRTAVSVVFDVPRDYDEKNDVAVEVPEGFIPVAVSASPGEYLQIIVRDETRVVLDVADAAFMHGPVDFWHAPVGKLRVNAWVHGCPSVLPLARVVIHGEIDIE